MFVERLLAQTNAPVLEQVVRFTAARHRLIAENIANIDTPGYRQKDLSVSAFQRALSERIDQRRQGRVDSIGPIDLDMLERRDNILFHDGGNRSMEQLATEQAKNALMHNVAIEFLRRQYQSMENALRERVS